MAATDAGFLMTDRLRRKAAYRHVSAILLGAAMVAGFSPFLLAFVPVLVPAAFFWLLQDLAPKAAFRTGFLFGAGWFGAGTYWLYISLHDFGNAPLLLAVLLMLGLVAIMALYYGAFAGLLARFAPRGMLARWLVFVPALWVLLEWLRGWILSGFPWFALGYSQTDTWLAGFAPLLGVFGVSGAVVLLAAAVRLAFVADLRLRLIAAIVALLIVGTAFVLQRVVWTQPVSEIRVGLVQGNVAQDLKWLREQRVPTMQKYWRLTEQVKDADLVIWPEAAIPALYGQLADTYFADVEENLLGENQRLLTGVLVSEPEKDIFYNSAVVLGGEHRFYHKRHLVPFGEYFPVPSFVRNWLRLMNLPYSDFETGDGDNTLKISEQLTAAVAICYEVVFGEEVIDGLPQAGMLVNISNDGWFGRSIGPHQHLQIARMRSIETGRWMVRVTNTGISAVIDESGHIVERLPVFEAVAKTARVSVREGATPYVRFGNAIVVMIAAAMLILCVIRRRKRTEE